MSRILLVVNLPVGKLQRRSDEDSLNLRGRTHMLADTAIDFDFAEINSASRHTH